MVVALLLEVQLYLYSNYDCKVLQFLVTGPVPLYS